MPVVLIRWFTRAADFAPANIPVVVCTLLAAPCTRTVLPIVVARLTANALALAAIPVVSEPAEWIHLSSLLTFLLAFARFHKSFIIKAQDRTLSTFSPNPGPAD